MANGGLESISGGLKVGFDSINLRNETSHLRTGIACSVCSSQAAIPNNDACPDDGKLAGVPAKECSGRRHSISSDH